MSYEDDSVKELELHFQNVIDEYLQSYIPDDENLFLGYRISEKDQEKFYFIENVEYRLFNLCDVLAQMCNELFEVEKNIVKKSS